MDKKAKNNPIFTIALVTISERKYYNRLVGKGNLQRKNLDSKKLKEEKHGTIKRQKNNTKS